MENLKNKVLKSLALLIDQNRKAIVSANKADVLAVQNIDPSLLDRLKVDLQKVDGMITSVEQLINLPDPEGVVLSSYTHPNGMLVENKRVAFGTILIIYESRPDVTIEAAITAFKAGNKIILKGGKEARLTNLKLVELWHKALEQNGFDKSYIQYLDLGRAEVQKLIKNEREKIDLIIPRGGEGLINYIKENSSVPVIVSGRGNNFMFVDESFDFDILKNVALNGKSRLSVCNALDKIIFSSNIENLDKLITELADSFKSIGIEVYGPSKVAAMCNSIIIDDSEEILSEEFLSEKIYFTFADTLETGIELINKYSGGHSATVISSDKANAETFQKEVDCAAVYHNVSTRFTDGGQFGFGAEIAISTQKLHFRGPLGLGELLTNKWFISGNGQTR